MRIALDYTSAVHQRAGVGRYTRSVASHVAPLLSAEDELKLWYASRSNEPISPPPGLRHENCIIRRLPVSPRLATIGWQRLRLPFPVERFLGNVDLHHAPDFVSAPTVAPMVTTIHDLSYLIVPEFAHPDLRKYLEKAVPRTLKRARRVIAVSESTRRDIIERYRLRPEQVTAIYNGVDSWFTPPETTTVDRALEQFGLRRPYFVMVGTVEPRKNHLTALRAFAALYGRRRDVSLVIVGNPGWLSEPIVNEIEKASRTMPVRYLRFVDDTWIPALYAGSVALLAPSWYEGFGLPVLEAMSCGAAVITSDRGALPEVAGDDAIVIPPGDVEALASGMERLVDSEELRTTLARQGRSRASQFTWERAAEQHLKLYREVATTV